MRYFINFERSFSSIQILDEKDTVLYKVPYKKGIHMGFQVSLTTATDEEIYRIEKKGLSSKYKILSGETEVGSIKSAFSILKAKVNIESTLGSFEVDGKINRHKYTIHRNGKSVAEVSKKVVSLKNQYFFDTDVKEGIEFLFAIAIVLDDIAFQHEQQIKNSNNQE